MKKIPLLAIAVFLGQMASAQNELPPPPNYNQNRTITTGVPFLLISADARAAGMADMGVATSPDAFSQQYNPAKYAFSEKQQGFAVSYTPYMSKVATDMGLAQLNYFNKVNDRSAVGASLRYFGMGEITLKENVDDPGRTVKPGEMAIDLSYSLKLTDNFSGAVAGRYINSNLKLPDDNESKASTFAVDIAGFYESNRMSFNGFDGVIRAGFNLQNLGPKISYTDDGLGDSFIPSNLRLGAGFDFILDEFNKITAYGEVTKLLVPTPQMPVFLDLDGDGKINDVEYQKALQKNNQAYNDISWSKGIFKSFGDAPGGMSEEFKEFTWSLGAEYWYQNSFAFRTGYFHESEEKGARQYATLGAGFKYNFVTIDVSYLFATGKIQNPLDNTLRFSLTFNFGKEY